MRTHVTFEEIRHVSLRWFLPPLLCIAACVAGVFLLSAQQREALDAEAAAATSTQAWATRPQAAPAPSPARDDSPLPLAVDHVQAF